MTEHANDATGRLFLVATPIGNLEDMTFRAVRVLKEADLIAAEDTRRTAGLCSHYGIGVRRMVSYHAHNEHQKTSMLLDRVQAGLNVAVVTDSGMPVVSDPGFLLVREAVKRGIEPEVIPGPSALTYGIAVSGLPPDRVRFYGFPPRKSGQRRRFLQSLEGCDCAVYLFESVHRIVHLLDDVRAVCGDETEIVVIREATKWHEERLRGTVGRLCEQLQGKEWKGEVTVALDLRQ